MRCGLAGLCGVRPRWAQTPGGASAQLAGPQVFLLLLSWGAPQYLTIIFRIKQRSLSFLQFQKWEQSVHLTVCLSS